mgnify:CR=1 FL=1
MSNNINIFDMRKNGNNTQDIRNPFADKNIGILPGNNLDFVDNVS